MSDETHEQRCKMCGQRVERDARDLQDEIEQWRAVQESAQHDLELARRTIAAIEQLIDDERRATFRQGDA